ncbi:MAG: TolC family protein [Candidatus Aminicenantes bacterium]|nr:TolC family protein [Candidatus Aminicenantes bacterium]
MTRKLTFLLRTTAVAILSVASLSASPSAPETGYTLEEIIAIALERNPRIAAGALETEARESAYQASKRLINPQFEFGLGRAEYHDRPEGRKTFSLAVTQPIESPFKRRHRIEIEKTAWEEAIHFQSFRTMEVIFDIKLGFYSLLLLQEREVLLKRIARSVREMEALVRKRAELGEVKHLDAIKLQVEALKAENEIAALQAEIEQGRENLNVLLDNALPPGFKVSGKLDSRPVSLDADALIERALVGHPLIQAGVRQLEQRRHNVLFVKGQRFPDFALTGFAGSGLDGINKGAGITLSIPLWNFRSNELAEALSLSRMSERELGAVRSELVKDIRNCVRRFRLAEKTLSVYTAGLLRQVEESLAIAEVSYREGEISLLDFLDSQRTYNSVLGDYYQALFAWNVEMAALEKAAGAAIQ